MPKPRQGQKKPNGTTAIPKPKCHAHEEPVIMVRLYVQKKVSPTKKTTVKWGWGCPVCGHSVRDNSE